MSKLTELQEHFINTAAKPIKGSPLKLGLEKWVIDNLRKGYNFSLKESEVIEQIRKSNPQESPRLTAMLISGIYRNINQLLSEAEIKLSAEKMDSRWEKTESGWQLQAPERHNKDQFQSILWDTNGARLWMLKNIGLDQPEKKQEIATPTASQTKTPRTEDKPAETKTPPIDAIQTPTPIFISSKNQQRTPRQKRLSFVGDIPIEQHIPVTTRQGRTLKDLRKTQGLVEKKIVLPIPENISEIKLNTTPLFSIEGPTNLQTLKIAIQKTLQDLYAKTNGHLHISQVEQLISTLSTMSKQLNRTGHLCAKNLDIYIKILDTIIKHSTGGLIQKPHTNRIFQGPR